MGNGPIRGPVGSSGEAPGLPRPLLPLWRLAPTVFSAPALGAPAFVARFVQVP